ncbi:MAG: type II toxin-antitoxin system VapC family toxin [Deferrisomatales bacterium]|nr:type II toxin-antitoxin system VapC family toxin [Deferrisomatales bacterium]
MSLRFLLDTNVVSQPVAPVPDPNVLAKLKENQMEMAIAAVVWHELVFGARRLPRSRRRRAIERFLAEVVEPCIPIVPYDAAAAGWHGEERARLRAEGLTPAFADGQVAATAKVNGLVLVTRNVADFQSFRGLEVENWFAGSEGTHLGS